MEREVQHIVLAEFLPEPAAGAEEHRADELVVGLGRVGGHVVLERSLVIEPFGEGLVAGAGGVQRARTDEDDRCLRVSEANLRPAERLGQPFAGAVGAPVGLRDRAAVQPL